MGKKTGRKMSESAGKHLPARKQVIKKKKAKKAIKENVDLNKSLAGKKSIFIHYVGEE